MTDCEYNNRQCNVQKDMECMMKMIWQYRHFFKDNNVLRRVIKEKME